MAHGRRWYWLSSLAEDRKQAPANEHHHHGRGDLHDAQRLPAGKRNTTPVAVPKIQGYQDCESGCGRMRRQPQPGNSKMLSCFVDQAREIKARAYCADGTGQYVVKQQSGDREFGCRAAHGITHNAVNAAAHKHAAALDIDCPHGIREQHDRQDEPGRGLAYGPLRDAANIICGRSQIR